MKCLDLPNKTPISSDKYKEYYNRKAVAGLLRTFLFFLLLLVSFLFLIERALKFNSAKQCNIHVQVFHTMVSYIKTEWNKNYKQNDDKK